MGVWGFRALGLEFRAAHVSCMLSLIFSGAFA